MNNYPTNNGKGRRRRFSWTYEEDHHIRQYSDENDMLPIHEFEFNGDRDRAYYYDEYSDSDYETNEDYEMDLCDSEDADLKNIDIEHAEELSTQQPPHPQKKNYNGSTSWRRRRRSFRRILGKGWGIPSPSVMRKRQQFRQFVDEETRRHRRILLPANDTTTNNNANDNADVNGTTSSVSTRDSRSQNVLHLLRDREVFGGGSSNGGVRKTTRSRQGYHNGENSRYRVGVSLRTDKSNDNVGTRTNQHRNRRRRSVSRALPPPNRIFTHRPITNELRTFAEQACVTRFESSYLTHLQQDDQPQVATVDAVANDNGQSTNNTNSGTASSNNISNDSNANASWSNADNNQNANIQQPPRQPPANTSSKAVSTISIAFSPDGKTMASTHGDHTVKITCCMTGKLLQTLVGHPRTPWTVKYHPHAGANHKNSSMTRVVIANGTSTNINISASTQSQGRSRSSSGSSQQASERDDSSQAQYLRQQYQQRQQIVASGCLGHQVRIWDWISGTCLQMIRLEFAIISLSFHPAGSILAIANGTRLHFWSFPTVTEESGNAVNEGVTDENENNNNSSSSRYITNPSKHMHMDMKHMLRCVHFLPDGKKFIVGGVNPATAHEFQRRRRLVAEGQQQDVPTMSFYLKLFDFHIEATRAPIPSFAERQQMRSHIRTVTPQDTLPSESGANNNSGNSNQSSNASSSSAAQQQSTSENSRTSASAAVAANNNMTGVTTTRRRRYISNPRVFVPRALLYNDGGFDVSPDGKTLCACAEYWLPEGVDNATHLLHPMGDDDDDDDDSVDDHSISDGSSDQEDERPRKSDDENNVEMDDANVEDPDVSKADGIATEMANASNGVALVDAKESDRSKKKAPDEPKPKSENRSATNGHVSPTPPQLLTCNTRQHPPSATPPRIFERQPRQISSPPFTLGTSASSSGLPIPPMQTGITPQTPPPNVHPLNFPLSPPSPPGRRFAGGLSRGGSTSSQQHDQLLQQYNRQQAMLRQQRQNLQQQEITTPPQQQRGPSSAQSIRGTENTNSTIPAPPGINHRTHRQQRTQTQQTNGSAIQKATNPFPSSRKRGRFVPHVVTISLDTEPYVETTVEERISAGPALVSGETSLMASTGSRRIGASYSTTTTTVTRTTYNIPGRGAASAGTNPHVRDRRPRLGQLLSACPLESSKASAVTCVKFSPSTDFCLIGYGVREPHVEDDNANDPPAHPPYHPVTAIYEVNKGGIMRHVSTMLSGDDDVNIARFHPDSGYGFVYGTKQGRIRILGPRPWNYYNC